MRNNNLGDGGADPKPMPQPDQPTISSTTTKAGLIVAALVVIGGAAWYFGGSDLVNKSGGEVLGVSSGYQAVFLVNGQVYFGKLEAATDDALVLRDIYYLKVTQALQPANDDETATQQPNIQLVKLGSELHGPQDEMYLEQDKVLFWENMKDDSKVVEAIKKYQETK